MLVLSLECRRLAYIGLWSPNCLKRENLCSLVCIVPIRHLRESGNRLIHSLLDSKEGL